MTISDVKIIRDDGREIKSTPKRRSPSVVVFEFDEHAEFKGGESFNITYNMELLQQPEDPASSQVGEAD